VKTVLRGDVLPIPNDPNVAPKALRVRLRQVSFAEDTAVVEGMPIGPPESVRVLYDATTPIADAAQLARAFREIGAQVERYVAGVAER
jgi:hypothetical protein